MKQTIQKALTVFGEGLSTNVDELNVYLNDEWRVVFMCNMGSAVSTTGERGYTRFFEPQCLVIIEKFIEKN